MSVLEIEKLIGKKLPEEFLSFLDGISGDLLEPSYSFSLKEPTPYGNAVIEILGLPNVESIENDEFYEIGMLGIGGNLFGDGVYMSIRDPDYGSIYYWDHEYRCAWEDDMFYRMFPNLAEDVAKYIELRKLGELPEKEEEFASFYLAAGSFKEFINILEPLDD